MKLTQRQKLMNAFMDNPSRWWMTGQIARRIKSTAPVTIVSQLRDELRIENKWEIIDRQCKKNKLCKEYKLQRVRGKR